MSLSIGASSSSVQNTLSPVIFQYDCEVDGINVASANISEVCLRIDKLIGGEKNYFVAYMSKPARFNYTGPFQKPIPAESHRYDTATNLTKMFSFINKKIKEGDLAILMGYNVKGWDEPVLQNNCARFSVITPTMNRLKFFDLADVAHHLGFPMGTTQQQLEVALDVKKLPANRHRAHADVRVVKQIWEKMIREIKGDLEKLHRVHTALVNPQAEQEVAKILKEYDPSLIASEEMIETIRTVKEGEKALRKEIIVLYDTETTGLLPKQRQHHDSAVRVVEIGAKILSPYSDNEYNETFASFVDPEMPIPAGATAVHGITDEDVVGKPKMTEAWKALELWVKTSNTYKQIMNQSNSSCASTEPCIVLVGYNNAHYDNILLTEENLLAGVDLKRQLDKKVKKSYDVMMLMSTWYTGEASRPPSNKLQDHARFLNIPEHEAHRALGDVETLEHVLRKICGPINPTLILSEALKFPDEPGKSAKAIIKGALSLIDTDMEPVDAVREAVQMYEESKANHSNSSEVISSSTRKRKIEKLDPASQTYLVDTQDLQGQVVYI